MLDTDPSSRSVGIHVSCSQDWAVQGKFCQIPLQVIK